MSDEHKSLPPESPDATPEAPPGTGKKKKTSSWGVDKDALPRERLQNHGAGTLTDAELLAILLRVGYQGKNVLELAQEVIGFFPTLPRMGNATLQELQLIPGIGPAKAIEIKAAFELGKRMSYYKLERKQTITCAKDVADYLMPRFQTHETETLICLEMSTKNEILHEHTISQGGLDGTSAKPRDIFCKLVRNRASAMIMVHNHPSGNPEPSQADITISRRIQEGAKLLDIRFLDHIIIGEQRFVSLKERGLL
jgi:DNA repair protein RadC